jgi:uncharacterized FlaG/YvyC family protein
MKISQVMPGSAYPRPGEDDRPAPRAARASTATGAAPSEAPKGSRRPPSHEDPLTQVEAVERLRESLSSHHRTRLRIERDEDEGRFVYKMINPDTGEVLRRWPPETYGDLIGYLRSQEGGLVNAKA